MGYVTPADVPISDDWFDHKARSSAEPGTDYATGYGTNLRAPASGVVIGVDRDNCGPAGRRLTLLLDDGRMVDWIHLSEIWANVGDRFERGQTGLALSGASRYCDDWGVGPHVHVTLRADQWRPFADTLNFEDYVDGGTGGLDAQAFLDSLGYAVGAPGWGPLCEAATRDFQASVGLTVDGIFGPMTAGVQRILEAGRNATNVPTELVQRALAAAGFDPGPIDGAWGVKTSRALFRWQGVQQLQQDAVFGPASTARLLGAQTPVSSDWNLTGRPTADIQRVVGASPDGDHGPDTDAKIRAWQASQGIDADGIWGITSDGLAFPPAGAIRLVDFSFADIPDTELRTHGIRGVGRYLWAPTYADGRRNKGISGAEYGTHRAADRGVFFYYEESAQDPISGYDVGVAQAKAAEAYRLAQGLPPLPIYWPVDHEAGDDELPGILDGLRGAASVVGWARTRVYGSYRVVRAAFNAGVISGACQTYAWSQGQWDARAQLRQWSNGQWGDRVDLVWAMVPEYGQTPITADPEPDPQPEPEPPADLSGIAKLLQQILDLIRKLFGGGK